MASGGMVEVAKATITLVPNISGAQSEITSQLTGITKDASTTAGEEGGSAFGEKFASAIKTGSAVIGAAIATATAAAVSTGKAFVDAAQDVAEYGDTVDKQSQRLGLSAKSYQELDYVMQLAGTSMDSMSAGVKTLTNQFDEALSGSESAQAMFESLGFTMEDLSNMSREDLFKNVILGFTEMEDNAERAALANDLLGRSGQQLAPLFNMSAEEIEGFIQQANDYGMIMSDEAVSASADFTDSLTTLENTLNGVKNSLMSQFLPGLTQVTSGLAAVFSGDESGLGQIETGLQEVITNVSAIAPQFFTLAESLISSLLAGFGPMLPELVSTIFNVLVQAITTITTMLPQIMPQIIAGLQGIIAALFEALPVITKGLFSLISALVTWISNGKNVKAFINGLIDLATQIVGQVAELLPVLLPAIVQIISEVALALTTPENTVKIIDAAISILIAVVEALINTVPVLIDLIIGLLTNIGGLLGEFFLFIVPKVADGIEIIVNTVKNWGESIKNFISNIVNNIRYSISFFIENIKAIFINGFNFLLNNINNFIINIKNGFINAFNFVQTSVGNIVSKVRELATSIFNKINELPGQVIAIGQNLVTGIWSGISDKIQWVKNKIWGMGSQITSAIKSVFGIASPSKVWAKEVGAMLPPGLYNGFENSMEDVQADIVEDMGKLTATVSGDVQAYGTAGAAMFDGGETINSGGNTINVYAAEGQDVNTLADEIALRLEEMTRRKGAVYA